MATTNIKNTAGGDSTRQLSLAGKLAKIGAELGKVSKSGKNKEQGYGFIEYAAIAGKIRDLFAEYGVIIVPEVESHSVSEVTSKYAKIGYHYILKMRFTVINADDSNDTIVASWRGESTAYDDKGINKAETSGTKYFLMRLLNISEQGDDPDRTSVTSVVTPPSNTGQKPKKYFTSRADIINAATPEAVRIIFAALPKSLRDELEGEAKKRIEQLSATQGTEEEVIPGDDEV